MKIEDLERKKMATEWDMGWFCDDCEKLVHWKTEAYIIGKKCLCQNCAEKKLSKDS